MGLSKVPSVVSELAISSHRPLHNGKQPSGPSRGRDQANPFEAMLDSAAPEPAPKEAPPADKPDRTERGAPTRSNKEADSASDPLPASGDAAVTPDAATAPDEGAPIEVQAGTELLPLLELETDIPQATTEDTPLVPVIAAIAPPPVTIPVTAIPATISAPAVAPQAPVTAIPPAAAEPVPVTSTATPPLSSGESAPAGEPTLTDAAKATPQTSPADTPASDQAQDVKPQTAKPGAETRGAEISAENSADQPVTPKQAANKVQAQPTTDHDMVAPEQHDTASAQKEAAPTVAPAAAKAAASAKPHLDPDAARSETDVLQRDPAARPAADAQILSFGSHTQPVHSAGNVSGTTETPQAGPAVPVAGLAVEIAAQMRAGKNRFEIRLDPPELGRIDVRLDVDKDGNVTSRMMVERSDTLDLLRRDAHQLERALNQAGLKTADNALEFSLRDHGSNRDNDSGREGAKLIIPDDEAQAHEVARGYGRLLGFGNGLDIRV